MVDSGGVRRWPDQERDILTGHTEARHPKRLAGLVAGITFFCFRQICRKHLSALTTPLPLLRQPIVKVAGPAGKRRHLTDDQRAMLANEERKRLAEIGKEKRAKAGGKTGGKGRPKSGDSLGNTSLPKLSDESNKAEVQAAKSQNVPLRKVRQAAAVEINRDHVGDGTGDLDFFKPQAAAVRPTQAIAARPRAS